LYDESKLKDLSKNDAIAMNNVNKHQKHELLILSAKFKMTKNQLETKVKELNYNLTNKNELMIKIETELIRLK